MENEAVNESSSEPQAPVHHPAVAHVLQFFRYEHLPPDLQSLSKEFHVLAHVVARRCGGNAETTVALRKLLEAKDAAVRAKLINKD